MRGKKRFNAKRGLERTFRSNTPPAIKIEDETKKDKSKEYSNPAFEVGDEGGNTTTPVPGTEDEAEKTNEPPANKEKRGSGGGFNLLKPSNSDTFLALARRASNASRGSDEEDGANGVGERGLKSTESSGSLKLPEQERSVPIPGAGRRSSLADIAITLHTQSRGFFEGGILYAAGDPRRTKHMFIHPYGNRNPEEDEDDDFENLLNLRKRKPTNIQPQNPSALFVWIVVAWFMMGIGFVIVFGAETAGSSTYFKKLFGLIPKTENTGGETA